MSLGSHGRTASFGSITDGKNGCLAQIFLLRV